VNVAASLPRREIVGVGVTIADYLQVLAAIDESVSGDERIYICCAPASTLMFARRDETLAGALADAAIVTADGMGVVYAARLLGESLDDRVYGPDLMSMQLERAAAAGTATYLFGGYDDTALAELTSELTRRFPGLDIVGGESPPHRLPTPEEDAAVARRINASGAQIVWVGIGSPKQELWMQRLRPMLEAPVLCGVGAAFDFFIGRVAQAPQWMQRIGAEWLFRLLREPRRLGWRYLMTLPRFVTLVIAQRLRSR
jgi:N-acetylglucosaminyldiphosphoundecaprenol N-acetyl-beta-D-mannosaminyltransferase